jgi:hypothetical protein
MFGNRNPRDTSNAATVNQEPTAHALPEPASDSHRVDAAIEVSDEVISVFDADGKAHQGAPAASSLIRYPRHWQR